MPAANRPPLAAPDAPHAVVIGSGFGGLAAALRLSVRGYRVHLLEQRDQLGGRAYVYRKDGFVFDGGPTVITAPFLLKELWELAGESFEDAIDLRSVDPFYRIRFHDGEVFDYNADPQGMAAQVAKFNPGDVDGYERFVQMSRSIFEVGFEQLADKPFLSWTDMLKIAPQMMRLKSYRSVYGLVSSYIKDPRLRQVMSFHPLLVGGNPFSTTSIYTLIAFLERKWGVHFPMGGTGSLVQGLEKLLVDREVDIRVNCKVSKILVQDGKAKGVLLADGQRIEADVVVSNADSASTLRHLVDPQHRKRWTDQKIDKARYSMSLFVWYFGTKRRYEDVPHHCILLGPRYRGLLQDIFQRKTLAEDFSLYLHRPTHTDPSLAPPGCDAFYVLSPVPHCDAQVDWERKAEEYKNKICQYLADTVLPDLPNQIATSHMITPLTFQNELSSYKGAAFGLEPNLLQSAYFRPHNASADVDGLYFVGAGTHPGAGVPGVLSSAKVLDRVVPAPRPSAARHHAQSSSEARRPHL